MTDAAGSRRVTLGSPLLAVSAALAILTRMPVPGAGDRAGASAFGLVGALLGLAVAAPLVLLGAIAPLAAAVLGLGALAVATGGLHLDGLADTADALAAPAGAAEQARQDPRVGPAGVVALIVVLGFDAAALAAVVERGGPLVAGLGVVVATAVSRAAAPLAVAIAGPRVRPGFGRWFADRTSGAAAGVAVGTALGLSAALASAAGRPAIAIGGFAGILAAAAIAGVVVRVRGGLDGDAIGAVVELSFSASILALLVVSG